MASEPQTHFTGLQGTTSQILAVALGSENTEYRAQATRFLEACVDFWEHQPPSSRLLVTECEERSEEGRREKEDKGEDQSHQDLVMVSGRTQSLLFFFQI